MRHFLLRAYSCEGQIPARAAVALDLHSAVSKHTHYTNSKSPVQQNTHYTELNERGTTIVCHFNSHIRVEGGCPPARTYSGVETPRHIYTRRFK